jgi:hypothetical protein
LHPRIKIGAGADQPLGSRGKSRENHRICVLSMAKATLGTAPPVAGDFPGLRRDARVELG